jgi:eukaryotic-like serine/threonine-protein kinase
MEYLDGVTLKHRISGKPLPFDTLLALSIDIADGLEAAHSKGIVHRDIKPDNIFVSSRGHAKTLDFGLSKLTPAGGSTKISSMLTAGASEHLTQAGSAIGTISYMSPEQVRGAELDARTDLFSFGVVLYEMVTGVLPFRGETALLIAEAILNRTPAAAVRLNPDIPGKLEEIINKALEKNRDLRYQNAADIRADLQRLKRDSNVAFSAAGRDPSSSAEVARRVSHSGRVAVLSTQAESTASDNPLVCDGRRSPAEYCLSSHWPWAAGCCSPARPTRSPTGTPSYLLISPTQQAIQYSTARSGRGFPYNSNNLLF